MTQKKKAVIYCRVSTKEQVDEGNSLKTQEKLCIDYAKKNLYEVVHIFIESGESAKTTDRTELKKLMAFCLQKKIKLDAVIVYRIDRLSRQLEDYAFIRSKLKSRGIEIKSTAEHFEDNPAGRFMENIIANVAQFDNDVRTERSINGMKEAVREGRYVWRAPFGYSNGKINGKPNIIPNKNAAIVKEAFEILIQAKMPVEHVRQKLIAKYRKSNIPLSKANFSNILRNEVYAGWIYQFGERHKGSFTPLLTSTQFAQTQAILNGRKMNKKTYVVKHPDFPLRNFFIHPSGKKITGAWSQGKTKKYAYYFYRIPKHIYSKSSLESIFLSLLNAYTLTSSMRNKFFQHLEQDFHSFETSLAERNTMIERDILSLKEKQRVLIDKNISGILPDIALKDQLIDIGSKINDLESSVVSKAELPNFKEIVAKAQEIVEHPADEWKTANCQGKILLQWLFFPQGIIFDGKNCRTPEVSILLNQKPILSTYQFDMVHQSNLESNSLQTTSHDFPVLEILNELKKYNEAIEQNESDV